TGVANILFYRLIQMSSPVFATQVTYLIPIVACGWGFFFDEKMTAVQGVGAFVILVGVYLAGRNK
ncbi:MAG: permease, partial [Flavobacterium sp.]